MSSTSSGVGFRWLDILEKEFDKAAVMLDTTIGELEPDDPEVAYAIRQKMAGLSSCFAQLSHKAQTIFQNSAKIEAELINLRTELIDSRTKNDLLEQKCYGRLPPIERDPELNDQMTFDIAHLKCESLQLYRENIALRDTILALHSEVYGARLAAKYLDKELAGRIQQLQLLGREMKGELRDRLWRQLEAEILLQRHKTVVRACRSAEGSGSNHRKLHPKNNSNNQLEPQANSRGGTRGIGEPRYVRVPRKHHQGLGISITGGREHGVPILISELETDGPASQTGQLYVGDAILSVNNIDLRQACHKEAVSILQNQTGDCILCVQFVAEDSDDDNSLSEDGYTFHYPVFPVEDGTGERTPTAPRTPDPHLTVPHTHIDRSGSEDISDYIQTPENNYNYNIPPHNKYSQHPRFMHSSCYDDNSNFSSEQYDDLGYNIRQNKGKNLYGEYNTATNNKSIQHSILDMDDNTIKIETEIDDSPILDCIESNSNQVLSDDLINDNINDVKKAGNFVNITIVDKVNNAVEHESHSNSNSESVSSPMQTSSDNIINSSDPPPFPQHAEFNHLKSPLSSGEEIKSDIGQHMKDALLIDINKSSSEINSPPELKMSPFKDPKLKSNPLDVVLDHNDRKTLNNELDLVDIENYDKESRNNQNIGYLYPKLSTLKPFGLKQYQGLVSDIKHNFEGSSGSPDDSVETTPVHGKKPQVKLVKKKRVKACDWKSKGAYQAINNANTSDMDSPVKEIKPDKKYYKDIDSKFGVKTIQSIFDKTRREKCSSIEFKNNLMNETSSEFDSEANDAKMSNLFPYRSTIENPNTLMKFTPEHALPNLKPDSSMLVTVKPKNINEKSPDCNQENLDLSKIEHDNNGSINNGLTGIHENLKSDSNDAIPKSNIHHKHEKSLRKLSLKERGFRIGSAKRVPPPPDVIHIPLKDNISSENFDKKQTKFDPDISSLSISQKNYAEAAAIIQNTQTRQEKIETEINDIYPMLEHMMKRSQSFDGSSDIDIDTTIKLALGKLERSVLKNEFENFISKSKFGSSSTLPTSNKTDTDYLIEKSIKSNYPKRPSLSSYTISKDIVIEGKGDPDFGTPV